MSQIDSRGGSPVRWTLLLCAVGVLALLAAGCTWVAVDPDSIQGEYVAQAGASDTTWREARIILRDGSGALTTSTRARELSYALSDQSSPWIAVLLDDGTSMQLQYRRPGQLTYYDPFGNRVDFVRVGR